MKGHKRCGACWRVFNDPEGEYWGNKRPCPFCSRQHKLWLQWPPVEASNFLRIAASQDFLDGDDRRIALVFIVTALEALFYDLLDGLLFSETKNRTLIRLLLDAYWNFPRREQLFKYLRGRSLKLRLEELDFPEFYKRWGKLVEARNSLIHGDYFDDMVSPRLPMEEVLEDCLLVFVAVNNDCCDHLEKER